MFHSSRRFHSLLIAPFLLPFLMLVSPKNSDNNPPVAVDDSIVVHGLKPINTPTDLLGNDSDPDGDAISFDRVLDYPQHGNLYIPNGNAPQGYTPNSGYTGPDSFTYRIQDARGAYSNVATVTLDVRNSAPTPGADSYTIHGFTSFGTPNTLMANDSDPDGDDISFDRVLTYPSHGNLYIPSGNIPQGYTPFASYTGSDSFTYRICDNLGLCADTTVTLDVRNNAPTPGNDSFTIHGFTRFGESDLLANDTDSDGDAIFFDRILDYPAHGNLYIPSGIPPQGYTPNSGYTGPDSFTYRICDNLGLCGSATVTLDVRNNPPTARGDSFTIHGFTRFGESDLLANDSDSDGDAISFDRIVDYPAHGNLYIPSGIPPQGYTPNLGYTGPDSFTYRICDNLGLCATATVSLDVRNNAPTAGADEFTIRGFTRFSADDLLANDSDSDGDQISFDRIVDYPAHGNLYIPSGIPPQGYTPNSGFAGTDSFTYRICDNLGKCTDGTVTLNVVGDGEDDGPCDHCDGAVGSPINVSNGNMYLQQSDFQLPSVGPGLSLTRTYNSDSQRLGLFGRGWSTALDESILAYDAGTLRFNHAGGRAVYFGRTLNSSGAFKDLIGDLHEQVNQGGSGFTLTMKDGSVEQFNSAGKLLAMSDRNGNTTTLTYGANGFLSSITDPFGRVLTVTTNANGQATSISDTMGTVATYTYGGSNELLSVTYADNSASNFAYDGSLRLTTVTDALGHVVESHTYDSQGRAITSEKQGGVDHYSLSYVSATETDVTDGLARVTKYTFDTSKGRNVVTQVEGLCSCGGGSGSQIQTWTYDNQLNITSKTDALNHAISYTYDSNGNRLTESDPTGTVTYTYNGFAEALTRTDQLNFVTTNTYDVQGNLLSTTDPRDKTANFTYDSRGLLLSVTDARDKTTGFTYDSNGNLITRTDALLHDTQFAYDSRGRLTSTTNALGFPTNFAYDAFGRLNQITQADGTTIGCEYDLAGRRTAMTDAKGNRSTFAYDGANRLTARTDALNQSTSYGYDAMSNLISSTDALGRTTNYEYDDFNRLVKTSSPPATTGATRLFETIEYDAGGNVTKRIDTAGRATQYQYDALNRLTATTDADNKTTSSEYDALSRRTALVDAVGQRYRFNYNPLAAVTHMRRGTDVMSFTYDALGNRKTRTDYNGAATDYTYDALNRLKTITYPDTTTVNYTYDKLSRLQTATNENGTVNFDYNKMNRMVRATDVFGQVVEYTYDANGNRTKLSLNSATIETYRYDAIDRVTKILDAASLATNYTYDATNKLASRKLPNGILTSYQYDGLDRLTRLLDAKGVATIADHQYQYNTASQLTQIAEPTITKSYGYDAIDRLTSATYSNPTQPNENYSYDGVGNQTASQLSASYGYQRFNRLTSTSTATFTYDANGSLLSKTTSSGTTQYSWDFENRLRQVTLPNGSSVGYKYDALGRRIQRTPSTGVSTNFVYDGQDVLKDVNSDGSTVDYLNGPGIDNKLRLTDSRLIATGPLYFLQDQVGSTTALTNSLGASVNQVTYDAFGNSSGSSFTRYDYTGRERDPGTGLMYYRARSYDAQLGRFISEDPAGLVAGINAYAYVGNDPTQWADPSGLCRCGIKSGPEYFVHGGFHMVGGNFNIGGSSVPGGTEFHWHAEFLKDSTHDPKCCEVRQLISWNPGPWGPNTVPHSGFPPGIPSGTWTEDRDQNNKRYGRRTGPYSEPPWAGDYYHDNEFDAIDQPSGFPQGTTFRFRLIVVDVCQKGKVIYTSKTLTVNF
jgi:RHS repeat-associated protein